MTNSRAAWSADQEEPFVHRIRRAIPGSDRIFLFQLKTLKQFSCRVERRQLGLQDISADTVSRRVVYQGFEDAQGGGLVEGFRNFEDRLEVASLGQADFCRRQSSIRSGVSGRRRWVSAATAHHAFNVNALKHGTGVVLISRREASPRALLPPERKGESVTSGAKKDDRPELGRWQPGNHLRRCGPCGDPFVGGRKAEHCADCAYRAEEVENSLRPRAKVTA